MRGMEETVDGMRNVCLKYFLFVYVKNSVQGINVYISKKVYVIVFKIEFDLC